MDCGWLVFDYPLASCPVVRFQAHSVIEENGRLIDITPREGGKKLLFLPHPDGNDLFVLTLSKRQLTSVSYKLPKEKAHDPTANG